MKDTTREDKLLDLTTQLAKEVEGFATMMTLIIQRLPVESGRLNQIPRRIKEIREELDSLSK